MNVTANARTSVWERMLPGGMYAVLLLGLIFRLFLIGNQGFLSDVHSFEAWTIALVDHGMSGFYANARFEDYPPGYLYILWVLGEVWQGLFRAHDAGFAILAILVKLPAIAADVLVGWLIYAIGSRFGRRDVAFGAAALFILNPAVMLISAAWGQIDSIAGGLSLLAAYFFLRADETVAARGRIGWIVGAWLVFGYALLIKPQSAVLIPVFIAFAFVNRAQRRERVIATAIGIASALVAALVLTLPFHMASPLHWLLHEYMAASSLYPYNSVNAFNLWGIHGDFWVSDVTAITVFPQYLWGIGLVLSALGLIVWRYVQDASILAFFESCAIALLAFFMLATRMHERYVFDGLLFTIAAIPLARRYLWGAIALSAVLFANLMYSLQYIQVIAAQTPGVNAHNLWGKGTMLLSFVAVATFFALGYMFLGGVAEEAPPKSAKERFPAPKAWGWFDPHEGLQALTAPLDYIVMATLGAGSFILSFVGYWYPSDKIFDEVYFPRAATEYLQNIHIYENTHPPLTKLLITLSVMLFGGLAHGDTAYGWRFLDVVFGALVVMVMYAFAKRLTGSTVFAAIAALLLTFDGMHFVQSRIGTPEGFVVFFALFAVYALYRFLIASQTSSRKNLRVSRIGYTLGATGSLFGGLLIAAVFHLAPWSFPWLATVTEHMAVALLIVTLPTMYCTFGLYLLVSYLVFPRFFADGLQEETFGDGSYALRDSQGATIFAADGGTFDTRTRKIVRGTSSQNKGGELVYHEGRVTIAYHADGSVDYSAPGGSATYAKNETRAAGAVEQGSTAKWWLLVFTVMLGLLVSSKWYGVMGFGVSFVALTGLWVQRYFLHRHPALWGNPRGFRLDRALVTIAFVTMSVYASVWIPDVVRHATTVVGGQTPDPNEIQSPGDVIQRQFGMFSYHDDLRATHPYSSKWWEWPLDYVPVVYYYQDRRPDQTNSHGCCIYEVTTLPNPFIMWSGLIFVPFVGFLAWRERNKGYALLILTYLAQWLPWALSPRLAWEYHFYVNIPIICLCNTVVLQRAWNWARERGPDGRMIGYAIVGGYVLAIGLCFVFFYPVLSAHGLRYDQWIQRMWWATWIRGPG